MNNHQSQDLWLRYLDGQTLSAADQEQLVRELETGRLDQDLALSDLLTAHFQNPAEPQAKPVPPLFIRPVGMLLPMLAAACLLFFLHTIHSLPPGQRREKTTPSSSVIAHWQESSPCVWQAQPPTQLGQGQYILNEGTARLDFADGPSLHLVGPTHFELCSQGQITVQKGHLQTLTPTPQARTFKVLTPVSELDNPVADVSVQVASDGTTELASKDGDMAFRRLRNQARAWRLGKQFRQATIFACPDQEAVVLAGQRHLIDLGEEVLSFDDAKDLNKAKQQLKTALDNVTTQIQGIRNFIDDRRKALRARIEENRKQRGGPDFPKIEIDGERFDLGQSQEVAKFRRQLIRRIGQDLRQVLRKRGQKSAARAKANTKTHSKSAFKASISVNGKTKTFTNRKNYEEALKRMWARKKKRRDPL